MACEGLGAGRGTLNGNLGWERAVERDGRLEIGQFGGLDILCLGLLSTMLALRPKEADLINWSGVVSELPGQLLYPALGSYVWAGILSCALPYLSGKWKES